MDNTQLLKGVLDVAVLAVIENEDGYGYDIVRRLKAAGIDDVGDASPGPGDAGGPDGQHQEGADEDGDDDPADVGRGVPLLGGEVDEREH